MFTRRISWSVALGIGSAALLLIASPVSAKPDKTHKKAKPKVEVVFCLDTTGSMGGLIDGAKQKIWAMCNQIASGQPTPDVKVGLVGYRDKGDAYVTKVFNLTDDLDAVHAHLMEFKAEGGGDTPESVNEALHVAVHQMNWGHGKKTLRLVFLVGDAPPHMDYQDDVKFSATCNTACHKGITINTIQCGNDSECARIWKEICQKAEGSYVQIAQDGGVAVVPTPYDKRLAEINDEMAACTLAWGDAATQSTCKATMLTATTSSPAAGGFGGLSSAPACAPPAPVRAAAADRMGYCAKTGKAASFDLLDNINDGKVKLEDLKDDQLPEEMRKMTLAQRKAFLANIEKDREKLRAEALELDQKRTEFLSKHAGKDANGFDGQVLDMLRKQAAKCELAY